MITSSAFISLTLTSAGFTILSWSWYLTMADAHLYIPDKAIDELLTFSYVNPGSLRTALTFLTAPSAWPSLSNSLIIFKKLLGLFKRLLLDRSKYPYGSFCTLPILAFVTLNPNMWQHSSIIFTGSSVGLMIELSVYSSDLSRVRITLAASSSMGAASSSYA